MPNQFPVILRNAVANGAVMQMPKTPSKSRSSFPFPISQILKNSNSQALDEVIGKACQKLRRIFQKCPDFPAIGVEGDLEGLKLPLSRGGIFVCPISPQFGQPFLPIVTFFLKFALFRLRGTVSGKDEGRPG